MDKIKIIKKERKLEKDTEKEEYKSEYQSNISIGIIKFLILLIHIYKTKFTIENLHKAKLNLANCKSVSDFEKIEEIGEGTYGTVCKKY